MPNENVTTGNAAEKAAVKDVFKIDPRMQKILNRLRGGYGQNLSDGDNYSAHIKRFSDDLKKNDPNLYNTIENLGKQYQSELDKGASLDPETARQIQQQTRAQQSMGGNIHSNAAANQEAQNLTNHGEQLQRQRQYNAANWLGSGQTLGDYGQSLFNARNQFLNNARAQAQNYLQSGYTDYALGTGAVQNMMKENQGAQAQYAPTGFNPFMWSDKNAGQNFGQGMGAFYQAGAGYQPGRGSGMEGALGGALGGAMSGMAVGGPWAALAGGVLGGVSGGLQ